MTTGGISETGIPSDLIRQQMNELKPQGQNRADKANETSSEIRDTITLTAGIWERESRGINAMDEADAKILAQRMAEDPAGQFFGMSIQTGTEALRSLT